MDDVTNRLGIGGNNPPDPIDTISAQFEDVRAEAENWLDGQRVENEAQMQAVDKLRAAMRDCRLAYERGQKSATAPLYDAWKAEGARWKPEIDDAKRIEAGLVALVDTFKRTLSAQREAAERQARAEAEAARRAAEDALRMADAGNIEAARAAAEAQAQAKEAQRRASEATQAIVGGMRTVTRYEIEDRRAALHDIAQNDREAITAFVDDYVRRHYRTRPIAGVRVWTEKEAF